MGRLKTGLKPCCKFFICIVDICNKYLVLLKLPSRVLCSRIWVWNLYQLPFCTTAYRDNKMGQTYILSFKEESTTSHISQPCDQTVASKDKAVSLWSVDYVRAALKNKLGRYQVVDILITTVHSIDRQAWVSSFNIVNMYSLYTISLYQWIEKIKDHVTIGELTTCEKKTHLMICLSCGKS